MGFFGASSLLNAVRQRAASLSRKPAWASAAGVDPMGGWADLTVGGVTQRFRFIKPGSFVMGSQQSEKDTAVASEMQREVTISRGYWLADTSCTQGLWQAVMGNNPSDFTGSSTLPVEKVSWDDCQGFFQKLNGQVTGLGARFPTEAEWEYACRAGTTTTFSFGATITPEQVNYRCDVPLVDGVKGQCREKTVQVKSLPPNAWGLYEMHGNVEQWCSDWYGYYAVGSQRDPAGPSSGSSRVSRGGGWNMAAWWCRSTARGGHMSERRNYETGFRLAVGLPILPNQFADPPIQPLVDLRCHCFHEYRKSQMLDSTTTDHATKINEKKRVIWSEKLLHVDDYARTPRAWDAIREIVDHAAKRGTKELHLSRLMDDNDYLALNTLPESMAHLKDLERLIMYGSNISYLPRAIAGCENLDDFTPYTSYRLHWFPYEITRCKKLRDISISTRALYGNYKFRPPFPDLRKNPWRWPSGVNNCSICGAIKGDLQQYWISRVVATDVVPLLVTVCSDDCFREIGDGADGYLGVPHKGGVGLVQPEPK